MLLLKIRIKINNSTQSRSIKTRKYYRKIPIIRSPGYRHSLPHIDPANLKHINSSGYKPSWKYALLRKK